ncbi:MAG: 5'-methylthioadenosine/S-adenosylhomocysteine nucleosidase [Opitutales bacterium]
MRPLLLSFLLWTGVAGLAQPVDLLLLAADDATLQPLLARLEQPRTETRAAWSFWTGRLAGKQVVLARTEGDPLNAVAATTIAVHRHPPRLVVTFGRARAHDPALHPGDLVVSEQFAAFDGMVSWRREAGQGSTPAVWHVLPHLFLTPEGREKPMRWFPADTAALTVARALHNPDGRVVPGVLGSAFQDNLEADRVAWLRSQWHTSCEDHESAQIAGCALALGVPVVGLRIVDGTAEQAAALAAQFVEAWR